MHGILPGKVQRRDRASRPAVKAPSEDDEVEVPDDVTRAIGNAQRLAHKVAAEGFRCRASTFLEFL